MVGMIFIKNLTTRSLSLILYQVLCSGLPRYYTYGVTIFTSEYAYLFGRISKSLAQQAAYYFAIASKVSEVLFHSQLDIGNTTHA